VSFLQPAGFQAFLELLEPAIDVIEALGVLAGIGAAIDAVGGSFTMRYTAAVVTAAQTGGA
jgi:hypothetical protein